MLSVRVICIGKAKGDWPASASAHYLKLLKRRCTPEIIELPESKRSPDGSIATLRKSESEQLLARTNSRHHVFALDKSGKPYSSEEFASLLSRISHNCSGMDFLIGGANGLAPSALESCQTVLSLSSLTYSHQIARIVLLEQLYRAFTIQAGTPYHK